MDILEFIPEGKENAISRPELQRLTGMSERDVRKAIKRKLRQGTPILSASTGKGYWISHDISEIKAFIGESDRRRTTEALTVEPLRRLVAKFEGLDVIPVRAHYRRLHKPPDAHTEVDGQLTL